MSDAPQLAGDVVRLAREDEIELLPAIEDRAAELFEQIDPALMGSSLPPAEVDSLSQDPEFLRRQLAEERLWVAVSDDQVVGFAVALEIDGRGHLHELSVLPEHGRRGLGRRLIDATLLWALARGLPTLTLLTFDRVPWNRPMYERLGFSVFEPTGRELLELVAAEERHGLDPDRRVAMRRDLGPQVLVPWGWSGFFASQLAEVPEHLVPGRVVLEQRGQRQVKTAAGVLPARSAGRLRRSRNPADQPAIGDWVMLRLSGRIGEDGLIEQVLERKSSFSRKVAGARTDEQVVAANVDHLLVVMGLDGDFNVRRLERFLATAHESGAEPVVVLNKTDVAEDLEGQTEAATAVAGDVPVVLTAAKAGEGLDQLRAILEPAITVALVGSSGVGKSTLVNALYGETVMKTRKVRESDDRGKHTTTHRELIRLPNGCLLIDNPGIRELQLWDAGEGLGETFGDIAQLAAGCRFRDCQHEDEPGCAVHAAVETGDLEAGRLESYRKMLAELAHLERRQDNLAKLEEKRKWRSVTKWYRKHHKPRD